MSAVVTIAALAAEAGLGYPRPLQRAIGHPVGWFAAIIGRLEARWNCPSVTASQRWARGNAAMLVVAASAAVPAALAAYAVGLLLDGPARIGAMALLAVPGLAQRSLYDHVAVIGRALAGRDVPGARELVARIVGRDTGTLDEEGIARAAIESLAESFNDGIVAPAFWLAVGGLPGLYLYKAVNTADSMIGHRDTRYAAFGWAAARADDLLNLVPARLAGLIICLAAGKGLGTMFRFASRHASPNSGWPEAAMAGALRVRLGGPVTYDGIPANRAWLGNGANPLGARALRAAIGIYVRSCALLWILVGGLAWAL